MTNLYTILICLVLVACQRHENQASVCDSSLVATVNGQDITAAELRFYMRIEKAKVIDYFYKKHAMEVNQGFWMADLNGETPIEALRDSAWRLLLHDQRLKAAALKHRLIESTSFETIRNGLKAANRERENALRENRIVYGPTKFDERRYYFNYMSNLENQLKQRGISTAAMCLTVTLDTATYHQTTL